MKLPIFIKQVLPFLFFYSLMILITIIIDFILHHYHLVSVGRYLGITGTCVMLLSFIYSLRKRMYLLHKKTPTYSKGLSAINSTD